MCDPWCRHLACSQEFEFVEGIILSSNSCSTGNLWSSRVDSKVHELDSSPYSVMKLLLLKGADRKMSILLEGCWGRDRFALFHRLWIARERSGQNGISHPHWVKISDETNGQADLRAKQKFEVLSATIHYLLNTVIRKCLYYFCTLNWLYIQLKIDNDNNFDC